MLESLFTAVLQMSMSASVLALAVILFRALSQKHIPKAPILCLWAIVLIKLFIPLTIPCPVSLFNQIGTKPAVSAMYPESVAVPQNTGIPESSSEISAGLSADSGTSAAAHAALSPLAVAAVIWASGSVFTALLFFSLFLLSKRRLNTAVFLSDKQIACLKKIHALYPVRYGILNGIASPVTTGFLHPVILLPKSPESYPENELSFILAHEWHHIQRRDTLWNSFMLLSLCIHWFNPLIWISYRLASKDMEISCDESVLNRFGENIRCAYANAILHIAQNQKDTKTSFFVMGFGQSFIRKRVVSIMNHKSRKIISIAAAVVLAIAVAAVFGTGAMRSRIPVSSSSPADEAADTPTMPLYSTVTDTAVEETTTTDQTTVSTTSTDEAVTTAPSANSTPSVKAVAAIAPPSSPLAAFSAATTQVMDPQNLKITGKNHNGYVLNDGDCFDGDAQLTAVITPENARNRSVVWSSDHPDTISVDQNGHIQCPYPGCMATITAKTQNGLTAQFHVGTHGTGCIPDYTKLIITGEYQGSELKNGGSFQGTAKLTGRNERDNAEIPSGLQWTSDQPDEISVDQNGNLTALKSGCSAIITAKEINPHIYFLESNTAQFTVHVP